MNVVTQTMQRAAIGRLRYLAGTAFLLVLATGCATGPTMTPVSQTDERMVFNGFSVRPPDGVDWYRVGDSSARSGNASHVTFVKRSGARTYVAEVTVVLSEGRDAGGIEQLMAELRSTNLFREGPRQRDLEYSMTIDSALGGDCLRFDLTATDTQVPGQPGQVLDIDSQGYYCLHPSEGFVLRAYHSRRTPRGVPHIAGLDEGERMVRSVQMTPVNQ